MRTKIAGEPRTPEADIDCLKEASLSFQIWKKELHRNRCQFTCISNGNVITGHKNTKPGSMRCLSAHGLPGQLAGDQGQMLSLSWSL